MSSRLEPTPSPAGSASAPSLATIACGVALGATATLVAAACIIPDTGIVLSGDLNRNAVQILERAQVSVDADCACDAAASTNCAAIKPRETWDPNPCPQPEPTNLPHLMSNDAPEYQFCSCPPGQEDLSPLPGVELWVNDLDTTEDGEPLDELYAALLLDLEPGEDPTLAVRYTNYLNPNTPLNTDTRTYLPIQQPRPRLRRVLIRDVTSTWDLCNGAGAPLEPGWHQVTLIVTDRPWFAAPDPLDPDAPAIEQVGVPDFANGATQDQSHFVFFCFDGDETEDGVIDPQCTDRCGGGGDDG